MKQIQRNITRHKKRQQWAKANFLDLQRDHKVWMAGFMYLSTLACIIIATSVRSFLSGNTCLKSPKRTTMSVINPVSADQMFR